MSGVRGAGAVKRAEVESERGDVTRPTEGVGDRPTKGATHRPVLQQAVRVSQLMSRRGIFRKY